MAVLGAWTTGLSAQTDDPFTESNGTYNVAIGVRAGGTSGLTAKFFTGSSRAFEGIISAGYHHFGLTALYEAYVGAFGVDGLNWYYGGGAHVKYQSPNIEWVDFNDDYYYRGSDRLALGVDGIVGIEYKIPPIPIAISLDLKPNVEVWTTGGVGLGIDPGLGVKLAF